MNQTWENGKKTYFGPGFSLLWPEVGSQFFFFVGFTRCYTLCQLSLHASSRKTNEPNRRKWQKTSFWAWVWPIWPQFRLPIFFFPKKNLALSVTRCHGQLSSSTTSEKTNNPILRKFSDGRIDRQQWFHRMLSH